ncbi:hypothetical protein [Aquibacillus rhizosphaerae]|uniref:Uncharacterized protein n=1 Tax=Aquibacillus rhizosphaerae TaxID=3051431 RepID=A0ABT7L7T3_9BACI|nr:hypothetical protein [Aquibacillus sp. LR5S19]MDL4841917.1 hypothetical protein [Aquibacillus sp. LR5S19]
MQTVEMKSLEKLVDSSVQVCIYGKSSEDKAPWVDKRISKLSLCPDETHLRIYFDSHFFFAVPLTSSVEQKQNEWIAYDKEANLHYAIKSEEKIS